MSSRQNADLDNMDFIEDESKIKSNIIFGKWLDCEKKRDSLHANQSVDYLEYVNFNQFDLIENTNKGGAFSTIYSAVWMESPRWVWDEDA
ncbi:hypothetical protein RclHR1_18860003 [Rhizophagus clarus]|uniref:Uncharacterized protein n=1 Tax=Rhizophagus clarus TaxID=94130 RepID=A0A2Z6RG83_9GLOM|nr:hypothetical protein RclHR1_18860003 [Rhizophagus clarus]